MSIVTLSIKDIPYPLVADTAFHSINKEAAYHRIRNQLRISTNIHIQQNFDAMQYSLYKILIMTKKMESVWATVFEYENQPLFVVRNLAFTNTTLVYRRVLVVHVDACIIPYSMRIWDPVYNSLLHEEFYPSPSETTVQ